MCKLLSANFMRLKKDKVFWIVFLFMFAAGVAFPIVIYADEMRTGMINSIDNIFGQYAMLIGIVMAVFCSLFVGTEYSDGTIRNKIISGKKRTDIYLSSFISCAVTSMILCGGFFLPYLCIGIWLIGFFTVDAEIILLFTVTVAALSVAFSSVFHLISMLNGNKAVASVLCILTAFLLLFIGIQLNKRMAEPETVLGMTMTETGQEYEEFPNPNYLNDEEREVVQFFYDFIPGGQVAQCASLEAVNLPLLPFYSLVIVLLMMGIGLYCFKKKELK
jgi:ABC-2 type transport system permease protein